MDHAKIMENSRRLLALGGMALLYVGLSQAATIAYTASYPATATDYTATLSLSQFDPSLGTLTEVSLQLAGTQTITELTLTNTASSAETFEFDSTAKFYASANSAGTTLLSTGAPFAIFDATLTLGAVGGGSCNFGDPTTPVNCSAIEYANGGAPITDTLNASANIFTSLGGYIGTGTFNQTFHTLTGTAFSGGGGNINPVQTTNASLLATVTYTYDTAPSTPEPATLFLMGSALVGVGFVRRRAKRS
jgi:hypothetical protein